MSDDRWLRSELQLAPERLLRQVLSSPSDSVRSMRRSGSMVVRPPSVSPTSEPCSPAPTSSLADALADWRACKTDSRSCSSNCAALVSAIKERAFEPRTYSANPRWPCALASSTALSALATTQSSGALKRRYSTSPSLTARQHRACTALWAIGQRRSKKKIVPESYTAVAAPLRKASALTSKTYKHHEVQKRFPRMFGVKPKRKRRACLQNRFLHM